MGRMVVRGTVMVVWRRAALLGLGLILAGSTPPARAEKAAPERGTEKGAAKKDSPFGDLGGGGKGPIKIDADRLDVFDRENRAVFIGNVVAVQGDSTVRCSTMTVYYKRGKDAGVKDAGAKDARPAEGSADAQPRKNPAENGIQKVDCAGPVTVVQKDQVATGDHAVFDQDAKRIVLTGNVVLSQCQNVTRGQRLVYDMNTGRANMDPAAGGRVSALFVPGEKPDAKGGNGAAKGEGKEARADKPKGCAQPPAAPVKPRAQLD